MRSVWTLSLLALALPCGTVLSAQTTANCTYSHFAYPGTETILTDASGINKWGTIVGVVQNQRNGTFSFFRYADGSFTPYQHRSQDTQLNHRNDNGDSVGFYFDGSRRHGLLLTDNKTPKTIDYPGATDTTLTGINRWGTIVGYYTDSSRHLKGFKRWSNGKFQPVTIPNFTDLRPMDINDSGVISGATGLGGPIHVHGFWLSGSTWQIVDDPDYPEGSTELLGMNNEREYVGDAYDSNGTAHPIRLVGNSSFSTLNVPNAVEASASDISDSNIVVGGATFKGSQQAFVAQCQ
jgi:hypothetical protein